MRRLTFRTKNEEQRTKNEGLGALSGAVVLRSLSFVLCSLFLTSSPAFAQLDPLLFLKNQQPNVILAVDTANRMQSDADGTYYDPGLYPRDPTLLSVLGLLDGDVATYYQRKFPLLVHQESAGNDKFSAPRVEAVGDREPGYATFYEPTRLALARRGLVQAVKDNFSSARFGLLRMRQSNPAVPSSPNYSVRVSDPTQQSPTDAGAGKWNITRPTVSQRNSSTTSDPVYYRLVAPDSTGANSNVRFLLERDFRNGGLIPAGFDDRDNVDAPVSYMLQDARTEAARLIAADTTGCRNTVVVLVVGGGEGNITSRDLDDIADDFLNIGGRRVPIYVIAIAPQSDVERADLRDVAAESGGQYFEITPEMIEIASHRGNPVPEIVRAVNLAVQHTFISSTNFNAPPTAALPYGPSEEFQVTSPIVGTVNLKGAQRYNPDTGTLETLPDSETEIFKPGTTTVIPQRSNVLVTSALGLPGFYGQLKALRVYRPEPDPTRPSGYRFTQDGSRLWVSSTPAPAQRNIYTVLPGSSTLVPFDLANVAPISGHLRVWDPEDLITWIRNQPIGAVIGSTPAFLDIPSLDPPPDADYPAFVEQNSERRALIFVGANDGMLHALDARTGVEVWAFIPYNHLSKLRALRFGQSLDAFKYFVDSSPKIADVKVGGDWRTYLFVGQGPGGTFYNTFDVTLDDIAATVAQTSTNTDALVSYFADPSRIEWRWSFPRNTSFDPTWSSSAMPYGDLLGSATPEEKTVGETWSDPAIGQIVSETGPYAMLVGSGFLKRSVELQGNRGGARAGRAFYVIDVITGTLLASRDVGDDNQAENIDDCRAANDCTRIKNALQMDPVATGPSDLRFVTKVYIGDLDGKVYRFDISLSGSSVSMASPVSLYNAGASHPLFASMATVNVGVTQQYIFVGTGSDLLPSNGVSQSYSMLVLLDNGNSATKTAEILLERTDGVPLDEKVTAFPAVAGDIVFFTTTSINPLAPCSPFTANLYAFTFIGGPAYDTNGDGFLTASTSTGKGGGGGGGGATPDSTKVFSQAGARATAPFIVDQHLVFSAGDRLEMFGDPNDFNNGVGQAGVRILSWRLVK